MMKKRVYLLLTALLLLGTTACGKDANSTEVATTQEQAEMTTEEVTQEVTSEVETTDMATTEEITTEEATEATTTETTTAETNTETTTEATQSTGALTPEDAQKLIEQVIGTVDEETGNTFAFMHVNTMEVNGVEYHVFVWNWYVDGHSSHLTDLFVATDGSGIYEGLFVGDGATVYTETNYLEQ